MHCVDTIKRFGIILAGGKSSRMGVPKALLPHTPHENLLQHQFGLLHKMQPAFDAIFVSGNFDKYHCIPDRAAHLGPMGAVFSVLSYLPSDSEVLFSAVDMPALRSQTLNRLLVSTAKHFQDFVMPFKIRNSPQIRELASRKRSVHGFLLELPEACLPVAENEKHEFININTPDEWRRFLGSRQTAAL